LACPAAGIVIKGSSRLGSAGTGQGLDAPVKSAADVLAISS